MLVCGIPYSNAVYLVSLDPVSTYPKKFETLRELWLNKNFESAQLYLAVRVPRTPCLMRRWGRHWPHQSLLPHQMTTLPNRTPSVATKLPPGGGAEVTGWQCNLMGVLCLGQSLAPLGWSSFKPMTEPHWDPLCSALWCSSSLSLAFFPGQAKPVILVLLKYIQFA